jgi:hypothetical protein
MKRAFSLLTAIAIWSLVAVTPAMADLLSGSVTGNGIVIAGGSWSSDTSLTWNIENLGNNLWKYTYTFTAAAAVGVKEAKNLSHFILEVTNPSDKMDFFDFSGAKFADGPKTFTAGSPDYYLQAPLFGIKFEGFDSSSVTFSFISTHAPVWGSFYAKDGDGGETYAYNNADAGYLISRPDGSPVPIPAAAWLLGSGLVGLVSIRRRKTK